MGGGGTSASVLGRRSGKGTGGDIVVTAALGTFSRRGGRNGRNEAAAASKMFGSNGSSNDSGEDNKDNTKNYFMNSFHHIIHNLVPLKDYT